MAETVDYSTDLSKMLSKRKQLVTNSCTLLGGAGKGFTGKGHGVQT